MADEKTVHYHALTDESVFEKVESRPGGLSDEEARQRLQEWGPNALPPPHQRGPLLRFLAQFHNVLIYILIVAGVATGLLGHFVDTAVILAVVVVNAIIGFIQEGKAEKALEGIRKMLSLGATVLRDGKRRQIDARDLVPGDVVLLQSGDKVPADLRLFESKSLRIEESPLTGESQAVEKETAPVDEDAQLGDRSSMAFSGTLVTYGQGRGVVVGTGERTELGRINALLSNVEQITTPLIRKMGVFGRWLTVAILGLGALAFGLGLLIGEYSWTELFLAVVGLAVAAIPEGLPAILTITLAIGVQRMAGRHAIIRRLPAVETLGSVTVICSDKTGTLTRNEMTVQNVELAHKTVKVTGTGYDPSGRFELDSEKITAEEHAVLERLLLCGLLCNDSSLKENSEGHWIIEGDPTEGSLLTLAGKGGWSVEKAEQQVKRLDSIPFESEHKYMATLHESSEEGRFIFLKGAPEKILERCHAVQAGDGEAQLDAETWRKRVEEVASRGQRTLALAWKKTSQEKIDHDNLGSEFVLLGLAGIMDPPREAAIQAVKKCRAAGIRVKMITGDHAGTGAAIARQMELSDHDRTVSGHEIEQTSDEDLRTLAAEVDVFARTSPEHKLRLVRALQANGEVVAMTGDGVNDAPALKRADVGVAMGIKGTEVSKEAAEMVLTDDNFVSIAHAVEEGRTVYDNLRKAILFILPTNGGQAMIILTALLLGMTLPITPAQILWVNMITAVTLALALAFEAPEPKVMRRPPRDPREPILTRMFLWRIGFVSILLLTGSLGLFAWSRGQGVEIELSRTLAVNVLMFGQAGYLFSSRFILENSLHLRVLTGNRTVWLALGLMILLQLLFTYEPHMQEWFGTAGLPMVLWPVVVGFGFLVFLAVEMEKALFRKFHPDHGGRRKNH